ncbi:sulfurtransferase TusA family protein [Isoptericola variabilis]|uniref:SirA-like domain-containing protein n=1 Tax=Isoptericola variabilis (strain 225) TaxID=743718 RepID=F6FWK4_ISOV2|nr:sulfurtransferase TusA family protein [Isoptericola variabilis]AEG44578.1 SirA-like domain-containing protein [Isoptericola variabilis 225]TWH28936.1 tRNA 2-thiouridine synthesizing protein A [Isoptericola variabilis J7]
MSDAAPDEPVVVDARGLRCPLPVIRLAARARELPPGTLVTVLATDPAARHDVPAWARMRGHAMAGEEHAVPDDGTPERWALTVRLSPAPR